MLKGYKGMSVLESKNGGKNTAPGQTGEASAVSDIENALNFLDSEEYREVGRSIPHTTDESKKQRAGKAHHDVSKPLTAEIDPIKFPKQEDSAIKTARYGKAPLPSRIETKPPKIAPGPLNGAKGKTSGKTWLFCLGTAALIFFAILVLYEMGYLFSGP